METEAIKECPCCGGLAAIGEVPYGEKQGGRYVECTRCGLTTRLMYPSKDDCDPELVETWNDRIELAALEARIAELEGAALLAYEWSAYVAASKLQNTQEFLDGLFERGDKVQVTLRAALSSSPSGMVAAALVERRGLWS